MPHAISETSLALAIPEKPNRIKFFVADDVRVFYFCLQLATLSGEGVILSFLRSQTMYVKRALFFSAALVILGQCSAQAQTRVRLQANLSLTRLGEQVEALASGKAKYEARANFSKFSCEVEDLVFTETIAVYRGGTLLGFANVDGQGFADLNLDTRLGHSVPKMVAGNVIRVYDFDTGVLIFMGRL